jgi:ornithine--oxo-acid transaminase
MNYKEVESNNFYILHKEFSAPNYKPYSVVFEKAGGCWLWDRKGKRYLDMFACYSTLNQGHRHPKIIEAVKRQLDKITLTSRAYLNKELPIFLQELCRISEMEQAIPMNSGAEAMETAIKVARKWGYYRKGIPRGKAEIIVMEKNFHGRTVTSISFSTVEKFRDGFEPFTPGFVIVPFGDIKAVKKFINKNTVAVMLEPIQAVNGINLPSEGYLEELRELTKNQEVLLILDEIQTGLGRTGKLFAWQWENAKPDILCLGKALGGGIYPVSAVLSSKEIFSVFNPGDHGSTLAGNPLASAIALSSLKVIEEENLAERSEKMGKHLIKELRKLNHSNIKAIKGKGLLIGVELTVDADSYIKELLELGIVSLTVQKNMLRFTPPLVINEEEVDYMVERVSRLFS